MIKLGGIKFLVFFWYLRTFENLIFEMILVMT